MHLRRTREPLVLTEAFTSEPLSLEKWLCAQEAAGIICSLCGLYIDKNSHMPDPYNAGQFTCGQAIPLEIIR